MPPWLTVQAGQRLCLSLQSCVNSTENAIVHAHTGGVVDRHNNVFVLEFTSLNNHSSVQFSNMLVSVFNHTRMLFSQNSTRSCQQTVRKFSEEVGHWLACRAPACKLPEACAAFPACPASTPPPLSARAKLCRHLTYPACLGRCSKHCLRACLRPSMRSVLLLSSDAAWQMLHHTASTAVPAMLASLLAITPADSSGLKTHSSNVRQKHVCFCLTS